MRSGSPKKRKKGAITEYERVGYKTSLIFFLANTPSPFAQKTWFTEAEDWEDRQEDYVNIRLSDVYPLDRKRLYYLFDYGDNWLFEIRKRRGAKPPKAGVKYPRVVDRVGPNPEQYPKYDE